VGGKDDSRIGLLWQCRVNICALAFDNGSLHVVAELAELLDEKDSDRPFVPGYGFDVDELTG